MAIGTLKLLKALNVAIPALDQYQNVISMGEKYTLIGNFSIQIASFVFLLIFGLVNSESGSYYKVSYGPGIGAYLLLIFAIAAFVLAKFVFVDNGEPTSNVEYTCAQCGKKMNANSKFCDACGGEVKASVKYPTAYVCAQCGEKANASSKFCSKCGGEIVQKKLIPTVYCCSACGAKAKATDKFCATCGGAVIEKSADAE